MIVFFGIVVLAIVWWVAHIGKELADRRTEEFLAFAMTRGWTYFPSGPCRSDSLGEWGFLESLFSPKQSDNDRFINTLRHYYPFTEGEDGKIVRMVAGREGEIDWCVLDYKYTVTRSTGKSTSTSTYKKAVVIARIPMLLPAMVIRSEDFFSRIASFVGARDVQFESEEFNSRYHVSSQDEKGAYDLIHPQMMSFLMGLPERHWQFGGPYMILVQDGEVAMLEFVRMMADLTSFHKLIPNYFKQDHGFVAKWTGPLDGYGLKMDQLLSTSRKEDQ